MAKFPVQKDASVEDAQRLASSGLDGGGRHERHAGGENLGAGSHFAGKRRSDNPGGRCVVRGAAGLRHPQHHAAAPIRKGQKIEARVLANPFQIGGERTPVAAREVRLQGGAGRHKLDRELQRLKLLFVDRPRRGEIVIHRPARLRHDGGADDPRAHQRRG
jgi:hypothetical protein